MMIHFDTIPRQNQQLSNDYNARNAVCEIGTIRYLGTGMGDITTKLKNLNSLKAFVGCVFESRRGHQFRNHQLQDVRMKMVLESCSLIQPTSTILTL